MLGRKKNRVISDDEYQDVQDYQDDPCDAEDEQYDEPVMTEADQEPDAEDGKTAYEQIPGDEGTAGEASGEEALVSGADGMDCHDDGDAAYAEEAILDDGGEKSVREERLKAQEDLRTEKYRAKLMVRQAKLKAKVADYNNIIFDLKREIADISKELEEL